MGTREQTAPPTQEKRTARESLTALWPGLRMLSLGALLAWVFLMTDFGCWMTSTDDMNLSVIDTSMSMYGSAGIVMLLAAWKQTWSKRLLSLRHINAGIAILAALSAMVLILSGPAFLQPLGISGPLLRVSGIGAGIAAGLMALRIAQIYSNLEPNRVLLYALESELFVAVLFYFTEGTTWLAASTDRPALSYVLAAVMLPALAMGLASPPSPHKKTETREGLENASTEKTGIETISIRAFFRMHPKMGRLIFVILVFSIVISISRNLLMVGQSPASYQFNANQAMLMRTICTVCILLLAAPFSERVPLSKVYLLVMAGAVLIATPLSLIGSYGGLLLAVACLLLSIMNLTIWCLLAFMCKADGLDPILVFGLGKGLSYIGLALGYALGYFGVLETLRESGGALFFLLIAILAIATVVCFTIVFTEKDFDDILEISGATHLDLHKTLTREQAGPSQKDQDRPWQNACQEIGKRAMLSKREQEIFVDLARNRTPQEIAEHLNITVATVRTHTHNVYTKLDVHSRNEMIELVRGEYEKDR